MIKRLILICLILPSLVFAGSIQKMQSSVIAKKGGGGGTTPTFYLSCNTLSVTDPDIGSTLVANVGFTSTTGQVGNAYEVSTPTDVYLKIDPADVNMSVGKIDMYVRPDYSGTPSAEQNFMYSNSAFLLTHKITTGNLEFNYAFKTATCSGWSPTSGVWYHIEATWDNSTGTFSLAIDGTPCTPPTVAVQTEPAPTIVSFSRQFRTDHDFAVDELYFYDVVSP